MGSNVNVIGIVGGLGNEAMVDLARKIILVQGFAGNSYLFYGNSRLAYKAHEVGRQWKPDDEPELRKRATAEHTARMMQFFGCGPVGLSCNSAHELFREVMASLPLTFVDMIHETARSLEGVGMKVLVLGVDSLLNSGLYHRALEQYGIEAVSPSSSNMVKVMSAIYDTEFGIKTAKITPESENLLCGVIREECQRQGCGAVVLGCTELPLALTPESCARFKEQGLIPSELMVVDASAVLAKSLVNAGGHAASFDSLDMTPAAHVDWFAPATFRLDTLDELVKVQDDIIRLSVEYLASKGRKIEGSYMHLPTLFAVGDVPGFSEKAAEIGVKVFDAESDLGAVLPDMFDKHYG
ncbi:aspartate/glutamate racemase family protein [Maridesulfovibrio sp.]|uniref:aspartate/glutamate racemase family protein n=1 Tax=unclassified Maridesulfovibrio TaxID=2794999 RepID=UPI003AFFA3FA